MRKAFIVDSSEYWAGVLRSHLKHYEIEVVQWHSRATGWMDELRTHMPDFLFLEDQLPSGTGLKCLDSLDVLRRGVCVIFQHSLQGLAANQLETQALSLGAYSILRKPYRLHEIRRVALGASPQLSTDPNDFKEK